jgi:hypothetical protein
MEQLKHRYKSVLYYIFYLTLLVTPLLMQGCATYSTLETRKASLVILETTNPVEQKQRFGDLATLDGTRWLQQGKNGDLTIHRFHWEIPGAVMVHRQAFLYNGVESRWHPDYLNVLVLFQFNLETGELEEIHGTGYPDLEVDFKIPMRVLEGGKVIYNHGNWSWCRCDGESSLVIESTSGREVLIPLTEEQYKAALQRRKENYASQQYELAIEKQRKSAERVELISRGLMGLTQGYIEASAQSQQMENRQNAFLRDLQRDLNAQKIPQQQALKDQQQGTNSSQVNQAAVMINPKLINTQSTTANAENKSKSVNQKVQTQNTPIKSSEPSNLIHGRKETVKLQAFNEAILVCSKPDATQHFQCKTPVDVISGGPSDKDWSTPEALVNWASSSCPNPRKLPSTTHLVWGCGFAATNNTNSMDRSMGVEVKGRNTYYCTPKETSCRRTSP